ncbi:MAG: bifunctional methylenetetrahydrofolate dehydrogenase/methenyltetrahydrofolate cyclohydrolase FolD [Gemmatimonadales bacterium]|nr:bifunctional methylenetetrahydrofolate dehydrogenase/methenyltetrahydrofolate cyclohydrolase FolD [Gemmatimonadales bacterium]
METLLLKGKPVRDQILEKLAEQVRKAPRPPGLAVILVGLDPASAVYVSHKEKGCREVGFHHETHKLPCEATQDEVIRLVDKLNADDTIDGILIQLPLPASLDQDRILLRVDPRKDVDGFHPENLGRLVAGSPRFVSCTPKGIIRLLEHYGIQLPGKKVAIVGRSVIVGRPLALLLSLKGPSGNATVTLCHSGTRDLSAITFSSDIVIAAMGSARALGEMEIAPGAVVVDVGINRIEAPDRKSGTRLVGDVNFPEVVDRVAAITPVPGGVGPMTIAMLLENTWEAMLRNMDEGI